MPLSDERLAEKASAEFHRVLTGEAPKVPFSRWHNTDRCAWLAVVRVIRAALSGPPRGGLAVGVLLMVALVATWVLLAYIPPPLIVNRPASHSPSFVAGP